MMRTRTALLLALSAALASALAACGQTAPLKPATGHQLPVAPYGGDGRPSAVELLAPRPQASPERSIELRARSEDRKDDPYDLPPES
ncbi:MAG: hypothetical protein ABIQ66_03985 [Novosphingobium sp.]